MKHFEVIQVMTVSEMSAMQLRNQMLPYVAITIEEVQNFMLDGVSTCSKALQDIIAYVLDLKRYVPKGWTPPLVKARKKRSLPKDRITLESKKGPEHGNYKNGRNSIVSDNYEYSPVKKHALHGYNEAIKCSKLRIKIHNSSRIKEIIHICGGIKAVAIITKATEMSVERWPTITNRETMGYIPSPYIFKLSKFARDYDLGISRDELENMLP